MKKRFLSLVLAAFMLLSLCACGGSGEAEQSPAVTSSTNPTPTAEPTPEPVQSAAGTYTYSETNAFGLAIDWTLELNEDGTYVLTEINDFVGENSYEGASYTVEGNEVTCGAMASGPAVFDWADPAGFTATLHDDGTFTPDGAGQGGDAGLPGGGLPGGAGLPGPGGDVGSEDALTFDNVAYGDLPAQTFNAKMYNQMGARPVLVVVPGGAFRFVDGGNYNTICNYFCAQGYLVVQLNYTVGGSTYPQAIVDVKTAIQYVVDHKDELHADADNINILGCSAGGYLAAMAVFTGPDDFKQNDSDPAYTYSINSFVDFFGATQWMVGDMLVGAGSPEAEWVGSDLASMADVLDPTSYLTADTAVKKVWVSHGTADKTVGMEQSQSFYNAVAGILGESRVHFEPVEGAAHEGAQFYSDENFALVDSFIKGS